MVEKYFYEILLLLTIVWSIGMYRRYKRIIQGFGMKLSNVIKELENNVPVVVGFIVVIIFSLFATSIIWLPMVLIK